MAVPRGDARLSWWHQADQRRPEPGEEEAQRRQRRALPKRGRPGSDDFFFDCAIIDEDGKPLTNRRISGTNSTRGFVATVAVVLGRRSDHIMISHEGVVLGMTDARMAKVVLGDVEGLLPEDLDNGQFDVLLQCVTEKMNMKLRKIPSSFGPAARRPPASLSASTGA